MQKKLNNKITLITYPNNFNVLLEDLNNEIRLISSSGIFYSKPEEINDLLETLSENYFENTDNKMQFIESYPVKHESFIIQSTDKEYPIYSVKNRTYVAGYWLIKYSNWIESFCPLLRTISDQKSVGPFKTISEAKKKLKELKNLEKIGI